MIADYELCNELYDVNNYINKWGVYLNEAQNNVDKCHENLQKARILLSRTKAIYEDAHQRKRIIEDMIDDRKIS